jgi:microcystin-dependent protein
MSSPFVGEVRAFPFNFPPKGWAFCNGQLLPLSQNTALFSLLGTVYGGDGKSTFALPDLQGNIPISQGQGAGLQDYFIGQSSGSETVTLLLTELPQHIHNLMADSDNGPDNGNPANAALSQPAAIYSSATTPITQFAFQSLSPQGGSLPHNNMMPYLTLNFCIALQGVYPARS